MFAKIFILFSIILLLFACDDEKTESAEDLILGCWELTEANSIKPNGEYKRFFKFRDGLLFTFSDMDSWPYVSRYSFNNDSKKVNINREDYFNIVHISNDNLQITVPDNDEYSNLVALSFKKINECPEEHHVSKLTAEFTGLDIEQYEDLNVISPYYKWDGSSNDFRIYSRDLYKLIINVEKVGEPEEYFLIEFSRPAKDEFDRNVYYDISNEQFNYSFDGKLLNGTFSFDAKSDGKVVTCRNGIFSIEYDLVGNGFLPSYNSTSSKFNKEQTINKNRFFLEK